MRGVTVYPRFGLHRSAAFLGTIPPLNVRALLLRWSGPDVIPLCIQLELSQFSLQSGDLSFVELFPVVVSQRKGDFIFGTSFRFVFLCSQDIS